jgi:CBS domain containing-hemolysin-like protein
MPTGTLGAVIEFLDLSQGAMEAGDRVSHGGVEFIVLEADQTRVVRVRAEKTGEGA